MDGDGWHRGRSGGRYWAWVILWGFVALLLTAVAVNMLLAGTGVIYDSTEPRGTNSIVGSFVWLAGAVICYFFAVHYEHKARGLPHGKFTTAAQGAIQSHLPAGRGYVPPGRGVFRRHGPTSTLVTGVVFALLGLGMIFVALQSHAEAARSSYTQANGVSDTATVTNVDNQQSCGRSSCTYYAYVTVTLQRPVAGHTSTVVNVPDNVSYSNGSSVAVLVDPHDPGYAELPGSPYQTNGGTVSTAIFMVISLGLGVLGIVRGLRMRARERAWRAAGSPDRLST